MRCIKIEVMDSKRREGTATMVTDMATNVLRTKLSMSYMLDDTL